MTLDKSKYCTHTKKGQFCMEKCEIKAECFLGLPFKLKKEEVRK
jgi:hypothetical protein